MEAAAKKVKKDKKKIQKQCPEITHPCDGIEEAENAFDLSKGVDTVYTNTDSNNESQDVKSTEKTIHDTPNSVCPSVDVIAPKNPKLYDLQGPRPRSQEAETIPEYQLEAQGLKYRHNSLNALSTVSAVTEAKPIMNYPKSLKKNDESSNEDSAEKFNIASEIIEVNAEQISCLQAQAIEPALSEPENKLTAFDPREIEVDLSKIREMLESVPLPNLELESSEIAQLSIDFREISVDLIQVRAMLKIQPGLDLQDSDTKESNMLSIEAAEVAMSHTDLNNNGVHSSEFQEEFAASGTENIEPIEAKSCQSIPLPRSPELSPSLVNDLAQYYGFGGQSWDVEGLQFVRAKRTEQIPLETSWRQLHRMVDEVSGENTPPSINRGTKPLRSPLGQLTSAVSPTSPLVRQTVKPLILDASTVKSESTVVTSGTEEDADESESENDDEDEEEATTVTATSTDSFIKYFRSPSRRRAKRRSVLDISSSLSLAFRRMEMLPRKKYKTLEIASKKHKHDVQDEVELPKPPTRMKRAKSWVGSQVGRMGRWLKEKLTRKNQVEGNLGSTQNAAASSSNAPVFSVQKSVTKAPAPLYPTALVLGTTTTLAEKYEPLFREFTNIEIDVLNDKALKIR